jgi:hypothetical protein
LQGFLSRRCSREFLSLYLQQNPNLLDQVSNPGLFLSCVPEVRLATRLQKFELLPEDRRKKFVETVSNYAIEGQDASALDDADIQSLFIGDEFGNLLQKVQIELLPRLDDVRQEWEWNYSSGEPPEQYIQPLLEFFASLKRPFLGDESVIRLIDREIQCAREWIAEKTPEEPQRNLRKLKKVETFEEPHYTRSIFDDIDETEDVVK